MADEDRIVIIRKDPQSGWLAGFLFGAAIGAAVGLFRAPKSGSELRQDLLQRVTQARQTVQSKLPGGSEEQSAQPVPVSGTDVVIRPS